MGDGAGNGGGSSHAGQSVGAIEGSRTDVILRKVGAAVWRNPHRRK